jgi:uncharacterized membrane protein YdjX (TVP38/TMEM64 family)
VRRSSSIAVAACAIATAIAAFVFLPHSVGGLRDLIAGLGTAGPLILLAAWTVLTPAMFPGTVLAAAAGLAFGPLAGAGIAVVGTISGALAAFAISRGAGRRAARRLVARTPKLRKVEALLERQGREALLVARLLPGVPAGALNYAAGVSPVRLGDFAIVAAVGALLRTAPYAVIGAGLVGGTTSLITAAAASVGIGLLAVVYATCRYRQKCPAR